MRYSGVLRLSENAGDSTQRRHGGLPLSIVKGLSRQSFLDDICDPGDHDISVCLADSGLEQ